MKKLTKRVLALILAMVMILGCAPMTAMAAEKEGRTWFTLTSGSNNGGGHNYGNGASSGPLFYLDDDKEMVSGGTISLALKPSNNWGVFYSYIDDNNWLYVGYDNSSKWYYQYRWNGQESYPGISGLPDPVEGEELSLTISLSNETLAVTVNGTTAYSTNQTLKNMANALTASKGNLGKFGVMTKGSGSKIEFADFVYDGTNCMKDDWRFCADRAGQKVDVFVTALAPVSGTITNVDGEPVKGATVRVGVNSVETDENGKYSFEGIQIGEYSFAVTKAGYQAYSSTITVEDIENNVIDATIEPKAALNLNKYDVIESDSMKVYVGKEFPLVARYEMKSDATGATFFRGNETELNEVVINGTSIVPVITNTEEPTPQPEDKVDLVFDDVTEKDYFNKAVYWAVGKKITSGYGDNKFAPNNSCTRAEIVTFLWRANGRPEPTKTSEFSEVTEKDYFYKAVSWAVEKGITAGY